MSENVQMTAANCFPEGQQSARAFIFKTEITTARAFAFFLYIPERINAWNICKAGEIAAMTLARRVQTKSRIILHVKFIAILCAVPFIRTIREKVTVARAPGYALTTCWERKIILKHIHTQSELYGNVVVHVLKSSVCIHRRPMF